MAVTDILFGNGHVLQADMSPRSPMISPLNTSHPQLPSSSPYSYSQPSQNFYAYNNFHHHPNGRSSVTESGLSFQDEPISHQLARDMESHWDAAFLKAEAGQNAFEAFASPTQSPTRESLLLSPVSSRSYSSYNHPSQSPSMSPDLRMHHDLPRILHPDSSPEVELMQFYPGGEPASFDASTHAYSKRTAKAPPPKEADPDAAAFLRKRLGEDKWNIFSARLFERRLTGSKSRVRGQQSEGPRSASVFDFLVKVEVVKEVLRTMLPNPYLKQKYADHSFDDSSKGHVILTRPTVLALCGWSNTQFSYWARRVEAIAVLAPYDELLQKVKNALLRRLQPSTPPDSPDGITGAHTHPSPSTPISPLTEPLSVAGVGNTASLLTDCPVDGSEPSVTGKGLDQRIQDVTKRTGASPFRQGKHATLEPFDAPESASAAYQPLFQAQMYSPDRQPVHIPAVGDAATKKRKRRESDVSIPTVGEHTAQSASPVELSFQTSFGNQSLSRLSYTVSDSRDSTPPPHATALDTLSGKMTLPPGGKHLEVFPPPYIHADIDRLNKRARYDPVAV
ncbi:hypothetical protein OF83DRAFT_1084104 [Amylostereum chailletii]|nr:hypothetical protein OF83DRAFT_1084104 [Amylostereum chailletii]